MMMKRILVCIFALALVISCMPSAFADAAEDDAAPQGESGAAYSVVSAVVNREYDFKYDFHDSYLYDDDFRTEGVFKLDDYNGDITLTLKNNGTGEEFVYEKNADTSWSVKASVDHLLYETAQLDAEVCIYDLGGEYGIQDTSVPVTITVVSSLYSADFHKYPSYDGSYTAMYEGEDFAIDYDASSPDGKATVTLLKKPWLFVLNLYNAETGETEDYDPDDSVFEFPTEIEVDDFDPSSDSFWFFFPVKLIMDDGYGFEFTMSVHGFLNKKATDDSADKPAASADADAAKGSATNDSAAKGSAATPDAAKKSSNPVKTGDSDGVFVIAGICLLAAAILALFGKKRRSAH